MSEHKDAKSAGMSTTEQNEVILAALKACKRERTIEQLMKKCRMSKGCVWRSLKRLEAQGLVCQVGEFKSVGKTGFAPTTWKFISDDADRVIHRRISTHEAQVSGVPERLRNLDVPVVGVFRIAALQAEMTAQERAAAARKKAA